MGGGYAPSKLGLPPDGGGSMRGVMPCYKESACGGRSSRHSAVTRFAGSPSPYPLPVGEGVCVAKA